MSTPGAGQNINLAALWIPVMPDTAHMGEEMRKAGGEAKSQFEQGFNSSGSSPENIGQSFGSKLIASINKEMKGLELPLGTSSVFERLNGEVDKNAEKLRGKASEALRTYSAEYDKLGAAQARASEAEQKVNAAREAGFSKASILLPLIQEQTAAQNALKQAHVNTTAALEDYNGHLGRLSEAHKEASNSGSMMAGIMGGAVVAGVGLAVSAVDKLAEGVVEGFKMAIEISKELAEKTLELGETYEHIGIQIREFSGATGEEFESMEASAQKVFSTLDVAGADVGKTMAQLSSSMGVPGESIESLVHNVTDLQGRFTSLKTQDIAAVFTAFKTPAKEADSALASLLKSSRESGQDLGVLTQNLSGATGLVLREAGLNIQQAGAFMGDMLKFGEPGRQVVTGMSSAMKEFGKEGISFKEGMELTSEKLKELGNTAEGQDFAEKLFGTRNWVVAKDAAEQYLEVVEKGPDAFNASADSVGEFIDQTETLGNKFEEFKHKAEDVFKPFGTAAQTLATQGLNNVSTWFTTHQPEILADIKSWGDKMIDEIPVIQKFAEDGLRIFGDFSQVILAGLAPITLSLGVAGAGALALTGHFSDAKDLMIAAAKIPATPIADMANTMADKIAAMHVDTQGIRDDFDAAVNSALAMPPGIGTGVRGFAGVFSTAGPAAVPPGGSASASGPQSGSINPAFGDGKHVADWDAIASKEGGGQWNTTYNTGVPEGGGLQIKPGTWADFGGLEFAPKPYMATKEQQEEVANRILNGWKGNAGQGPGAWPGTYVEARQNGNGPGEDSSAPTDPTAAVAAGGGLNLSTVAVAAQKFANDCIDASARIILSHSGVNLSEEDLEKVITPGGSISSLAAGLNQLDPQGNYKAMEGSGGSQQAMFAAIKESIDRGAGSILNVAPGSALAGHTFAPGHFIAATGYNADGTINVSDTAKGTKYTVSAQDAYQATMGRGIVAGTGQGPAAEAGPGGVLANAPSYGTTPGGKNGAQYPGLPGQYGGYGVYGGETADQQFSAQQAVQEAQDRQADLDYQVQKNQQRIDDLNKQIADVGVGDVGLVNGKPMPRTPAQQAADDKKRETLQRELDDATHQLTVSQREQSEQGGKIAQAQRKQQEAMYKKPSTQAGGNKDAQSLGSGLLAGIGEELGLGTVFTKSPLDWGIVKLAEGLFNYANGLGDAIFGQTGGMGGPGGAGGLGGGLATGLLGSLGIKAPTAMLSAGPNVVPAPPMPPPGVHAGSGAAPGPVYQDNSINISPNVDPSAILPPVINMQRDQTASANAGSFTNTGGFPAP